MSYPINNVQAWRRLWGLGFVASGALSMLLGSTMLTHLRPSSELVRMRNALLLSPQPALHAWTPAEVPAGFALDRGAPLPLFAEVAQQQRLRVTGDDWGTALAIARHLLGAGKRSGRAIQSNLPSTYHRIVNDGEGYCGDVADVFTGLANTVGLFSRPWAFSFDGFGGRGHIFNEIWDAQARRWVMLDIHNNFYVTDAADRALSAIEFRDRLAAHDSALKLVPIAPAARPGFARAHDAFFYYRAGLPEWYMWWGTNVVEYDQSNLVQQLARVHRAVEQLGAIAAGVHPRLRILESADNAPQRQALEWLRWRLLAIVGLGAATLTCAIGWLVMSGASWKSS